jgi:hypothetical protein
VAGAALTNTKGRDMGGKTKHDVSELYKTVSRLDPAIARRWKDRTNDDPNHKFTAADIEAIVGPLVEGRGEISENQSKAIVELMDNPRASRPALNKLTQYVEKIGAQLRFQAVALKGDALKPVYAALGHGTTGRIMFQSPKTNISYAPSDYAAVADLVAANQIDVFEIKNDRLYKLSWEAAFVISGVDMIFLYRAASPLERAFNIVHEATHVIQDKRGDRSPRQYHEADAYIAEAIAVHALNKGKAYYDGPIHEQAFSAAELLLRDDKSNAGKAYDKVVDAVAAEYKNPKKPYDSLKGSNGSIAMFKKFVEMERLVEFARDCVESGVSTLTKGVADSLP